jgi:hypothetical protein
MNRKRLRLFTLRLVIIRRLLGSIVSNYLFCIDRCLLIDQSSLTDKKAEDTYYQANNWASYDDWRRARDQWDYFYSRNR